MIIRIVKIKSKVDHIENLKFLVKNELITLNQKYGCIFIYFLESVSVDNDSTLTLLSVWTDEKTLLKMKNSADYFSLTEKINLFVESITDNLYRYI
ncbi:hypothetical protein D358_00660 [Enterococcus faecalis RP2S-4]|uniref:ABM domain-containing protein n=1 Tax=Enterococcus faecalis RP2S-4 TaxID=1244145 RepID=A0ABC9TNT0_ENTFL|nr:hypothetical protein D358_00660 [Enterococcus faecalis RP2S-4]